MTILEQDKTQITRLIAEGECLDPYDLEGFYRWVQASYEALGVDPLQQEGFAEYCGTSCDSTPMRLYVSVWMLKLALNGDASDNHKRMGASMTSTQLT
jgi:hypothetical protein